MIVNQWNNGIFVGLLLVDGDITKNQYDQYLITAVINSIDIYAYDMMVYIYICSSDKMDGWMDGWMDG